jgi:hypothetical protein
MVRISGHPVSDSRYSEFVMPTTRSSIGLAGPRPSVKPKANGKMASPSADLLKAKAKAKPAKGYVASIYPFGMPLPAEFGSSIHLLEKLLNLPIWVLIQQGRCQGCGKGMEMEPAIFKAFQSDYPNIPAGKPVGLLIESPGGDPDTAYRVGRLLQRRSNNQLTVIIPQYAKSAATLLALSASKLIMSENAELGPLDVQLFDPQREEYGSALDAVQSLERLHSNALAAIMQAMNVLMPRIGKRTDVVLPQVLEYVSKFYRPILEKIDTVDYTRKSRDLKLAEEYAVRLMRKMDLSDAKAIASELVANYPTHGFVIDREEAFSPRGNKKGLSGLGLKEAQLSARVKEKFEEIVSGMIPYLDELNVIGRIMHI